MSEELERQALREALYEGFEPPAPDLRKTVLASLPLAAPAVPGWLAWLRAHLPFVGGTMAVVVAAAAVAVGVRLTAQPPPPAFDVYVAYADTTHPGQPQPLPTPWSGSPHAVFEGGGAPLDAGAIRIDNRSDRELVVDHVTVDVGTQHFDLWRSGLRVPAHGSLILTQTAPDNFDTSETNPPNCAASTLTAVVHVTVAGKTGDYVDTHRVLTTNGVDSGSCGGVESHGWERVPEAPPRR
ncbi:MAG TPA: hypothetical protein VE219_01445 [Candidatus Sulfotelmatobacter sp.]|nr:hypothetical protein [Candidatus Sulfotelmatobacter sp.]